MLNWTWETENIIQVVFSWIAALVLVSITLLSVCNRLFATWIRYLAISESISVQRKRRRRRECERNGFLYSNGGIPFSHTHKLKYQINYITSFGFNVQWIHSLLGIPVQDHACLNQRTTCKMQYYSIHRAQQELVVFQMNRAYWMYILYCIQYTHWEMPSIQMSYHEFYAKNLESSAISTHRNGKQTLSAI